MFSDFKAILKLLTKNLGNRLEKAFVSFTKKILENIKNDVLPSQPSIHQS